MKPAQRKQGGFSLLEMIFVLVILGVTGVVGSGFIARVVDTYQLMSTQTLLAQRGRLISNQLYQQLSQAAPHSVRITDGGACVEYLPLQAVVYARNVAQGSVTTVPLLHSLPPEAGRLPAHILLDPQNSQHIYTEARQSARAAITALNQQILQLDKPHQFVTESPLQRAYLTDNPQKICQRGSELWHYSDYGFNAGLVAPAGQARLLAQNLVRGTPVFVLQKKSGSAWLNIQFRLAQADEHEKKSVRFERVVFFPAEFWSTPAIAQGAIHAAP